MKGGRKVLSIVLVVFFAFFSFSFSGYGSSIEELEAKKDVKGLIKALRNKDSGVRKAAAEALGKIGDQRAVEPLIEALRDEYWRVREAAAEALGKIGDQRAVEPLIEALRDEVWLVRCAAAEALGKIGDRRAIEPLIKALGDLYSDVREAAAEALGKIGEPLEKLVRDKDPRLIKPFVRRLTYWEAKEDASKTLLAIGWSPKIEADKVHLWVAQHRNDLLEENWEMTKRVLLKDIDSGDEEVIAYALYSFIALGKEEIIPVLIEKLNQKGTAGTAEAYLNCGHEKLYDAAVDWAHRHGYTILPIGGSAPVRWGSW